MLVHHNSEPSNPTRVVILGAGGFVSGATQAKLEEAGITVLALSRNDLDLTKAESSAELSSLLKPEDTLLFVSAKAPVKNEEMLIDNLLMAKTVCEAVKKSPVKHLIYISSDAVYADSEQKLTEESCAKPGSLHGIMHLAREVMLANAFSGPMCILRPTLIFGTNDPHNGYGPNRFIRLAKANTNIQLFGNGEEQRDHVWVEDVAQIIFLCITMQSTGILNCATGEVVSFYKIAEKALAVTSSSSDIIPSPRVGMMPHNGYRPFDAANTYRAFPGFQYHTLLNMLEIL